MNRERLNLETTDGDPFAGSDRYAVATLSNIIVGVDSYSGTDVFLKELKVVAMTMGNEASDYAICIVAECAERRSERASTFEQESFGFAYESIGIAFGRRTLTDEFHNKKRD